MAHLISSFFYYRAKVLYDRPTDKFHPITLVEKNEFLRKLAEQYDITIPHLPRRSGFIVSSTSWTEDEDFSILLNALQGKSMCFIRIIFLYKCATKGDYIHVIFL